MPQSQQYVLSERPGKAETSIPMDNRSSRRARDTRHSHPRPNPGRCGPIGLTAARTMHPGLRSPTWHAALRPPLQRDRRQASNGRRRSWTHSASGMIPRVRAVDAVRVSGQINARRRPQLRPGHREGEWVGREGARAPGYGANEALNAPRPMSRHSADGLACA